MKEVLYRGKDVYTGEWIFGWFSYMSLGRWPLKPVICDSSKAHEGAIVYNPVYLETVGLYIGYDDIHHMKIFEGDVVRCRGGRICKVEYRCTPYIVGFDLTPIGGFDCPPPDTAAPWYEVQVIGNIYETNEFNYE